MEASDQSADTFTWLVEFPVKARQFIPILDEIVSWGQLHGKASSARQLYAIVTERRLNPSPLDENDEGAVQRFANQLIDDLTRPAIESNPRDTFWALLMRLAALESALVKANEAGVAILHLRRNRADEYDLDEALLEALEYANLSGDLNSPTLDLDKLAKRANHEDVKYRAGVARWILVNGRSRLPSLLAN